MGRRVAAVGVVLAGFAACTTFSGGGGDGTSPDAGTDATSAADGPGDGAPGVDSGDIFDQRFDTNCNGWSFNSGASFIFTPDAGSDGGGACLAKIPLAASLVHDLPADQPGVYELDVLLRTVNVDAAAGAPYVELQLLLPDGGAAGPKAGSGNVAAASSEYVLTQVSATASDMPSSAQLILTASIGAASGSSDYYVDSVRVYHQQ
jgi:hypothetical protein